MKYKEFAAKLAAMKAEGAELTKAGKVDEAEAKKAEIEQFIAQFDAEKEQAANENAVKDQVAVAPVAQSVAPMGEENKDMKILDASSKEYRNAFLKHISGRDDQMTKLENEAFTQTTANTPNVLPTTMVNQIWDQVSNNHVIMGDITMYRTGTILELVKHTEIAAGKAKKVAENAANDDEQNTFVKVTLSGNDFSKNVELSYAAAKMSLDALESYLTNEIATNLGEALADDAIATIESGINAANKLSASKVTFADLAKAFGQLKRVNAPVVYLTRATLYNRLATLENTAGQLIYQPSATAGVPGTLLGAQVKIEDSVADDVILIGDPKKVTYNMIQDIMLETDKDIKLHKYVYSGYARGEGVLIDDKAFAMLSVTTA